MSPRAPSDGLPRDSGVTLVELLVVLAIIALAYAVAMPSLRGTARSVELRAVAQDLASHLNAARAQAMRRGEPVTVVIDTTERRYGSAAAGRSVQLPADVALTVTTARELIAGGEARMGFYPDGSSSGGRIVLRRGLEAHAIGVEWLTGLALIEPRP